MIKPVAGVGLAFLLLSSAAVVHAQGQPVAAPANPNAGKARLGAVPENERPPLAFRADFDLGPSQDPPTIASIKDRSLGFGLYGPGAQQVSHTFHPQPPNAGGFIWTGACEQVCGYTVFLKDSYLDMRGLAKIAWRTEQTGFHQLRLMLKLADGKMVVSDRFVGASSDWEISEMTIRDLRWRLVDQKTFNDASEGRGGPPFYEPDLSKVAEVGFTDLEPGSGHGTMGGSSRVQWIEVYAKKVPRG